MPDQATIDAVVRAAQDAGVDPAYALAVTDRESSFNPNAHASQTIYGLQQMSAPERAKYGSGNSNDPYVQSRAWGGYIQDVNTEMAKTLGRPPTPQESYLGHYWGGTRAARISSGQIPPETPTSQVFTPRELAENPEIAKAKSVGSLQGQVMNDITKRMDKYSDYSSGGNSGSTPVMNSVGSSGAMNYGMKPNPAPYAAGGSMGNTRPSITPETAMSLQNSGISPNADVNMEQPPPNIQNNWQQSPLDVHQPLLPEQQAMMGLMNSGLPPSEIQGIEQQLMGGSPTQKSQQAQQTPTVNSPRSVNPVGQLASLYPQSSLFPQKQPG